MFADIQFPINAEAFTYIVPDELEPIIKIGARVEVPFKRSYKTGIVTGFGKRPKDPAIKLKEIKSLLDEEPFLPKNILDLIKWVSEYYMSPSGLAL
ncbi:MAG TPA: primosomal protein N', partial [Nitrospirae bacterium]|nr:primosomal protein N' [Nitrospirota bacterium]